MYSENPTFWNFLKESQPQSTPCPSLSEVLAGGWGMEGVAREALPATAKPHWWLYDGASKDLLPLVLTIPSYPRVSKIN